MTIFALYQYLYITQTRESIS